MMREMIAGLCCLALAGAARAGWVEMLTEDFEDTFPSTGWEAVDKGDHANDYTWESVDASLAEPASVPQGSLCGWCAAGGANFLDPASDDYPIECESWLRTTDWIDISDSADVTVDFCHWVNTEAFDDTLWVGVSVNGTDFYPAWLETTGAYEVSGDVSSWVEEVADLSNVEGLGDVAGTASQVKIAIIFDSDDDILVSDGAFIDDVIVWKYVWSDDEPAIICGQAPSEAGPGMALAALLFAGSLLALKRKAALARA